MQRRVFRPVLPRARPAGVVHRGVVSTRVQLMQYASSSSCNLSTRRTVALRRFHTAATATSTCSRVSGISTVTRRDQFLETQAGRRAFTTWQQRTEQWLKSWMSARQKIFDHRVWIKSRNVSTNSGGVERPDDNDSVESAAVSNDAVDGGTASDSDGIDGSLTRGNSEMPMPKLVVQARHKAEQRLTDRLNTEKLLKATGALPSSFEHVPLTGIVDKDMSEKSVSMAITGNVAIFLLKLWAWWSTRSTAMFSEAIHTLCDCINQLLLLMGQKQGDRPPDSRHPYGYGRAAFFWSLVSAMGTWWLGAGTVTYHGVSALLDPAHSLEVTWHTWAVLGGSLAVDAYVLVTTLHALHKTKPKKMRFRKFLRRVSDPITMAVILEDTGAVLGVMIAAGGIFLTQQTGNVMWDGIASVLIGAVLGSTAIYLVKMNHSFLMGLSLRPKVQQNIATLLYSRLSIEAVYGVHCEWVGPRQFAYRAEIDFDGRYFSRQLKAMYNERFISTNDEKSIEALCEEYSNDLLALVENEVQEIEQLILKYYPHAAYIELEPRSKSIFAAVRRSQPRVVRKDATKTIE